MLVSHGEIRFPVGVKGNSGQEYVLPFHPSITLSDSIITTSLGSSLLFILSMHHPLVASTIVSINTTTITLIMKDELTYTLSRYFIQ